MYRNIDLVAGNLFIINETATEKNYLYFFTDLEKVFCYYNQTKISIFQNSATWDALADELLVGEIPYKKIHINSFHRNKKIKRETLYCLETWDQTKQYFYLEKIFGSFILIDSTRFYQEYDLIIYQFLQSKEIQFKNCYPVPLETLLTNDLPEVREFIKTKL